MKESFAPPLLLWAIVLIAGLDPPRWQWIGRYLALLDGTTALEEDISFQQKI
jgi:hypothetical protein